MTDIVMSFPLFLLLRVPAILTAVDAFWNIKASDIAIVLASVITSGVMIWAVIQAPKWAVRIQWDLQMRKEERDRRLAVFKTLMATRATTVDFRHVQALNMIDVEFSSKSPEDVAVRGAWKDYLDALNNPVDFNEPRQLERRRDLLAELLQRMGKALNYEFDFTYLKGRAYYPQGHEDDAVDAVKTRKAWLEIVEGKQPLRMEVVRSEGGADLSGAWLAVAQGKKALKVEVAAPTSATALSDDKAARGAGSSG